MRSSTRNAREGESDIPEQRGDGGDLSGMSRRRTPREPREHKASSLIESEELVALFRRKPSRQLPGGFSRRLGHWGEHLVGQRPGFDTGQLADLEVMNFAQADPGGFVSILAAEVGDDGAANLGAYKLVQQVLSIKVDSDTWWLIVDRTLRYLRDLHVPWGQLDALQQRRWAEVNGAGAW